MFYRLADSIARYQSIFKVAPEDILRYDLFKGAFKKELVEDILNHLAADTVCLSIVSQTFEQSPDFQAKVKAVLFCRSIVPIQSAKSVYWNLTHLG